MQRINVRPLAGGQCGLVVKIICLGIDRHGSVTPSSPESYVTKGKLLNLSEPLFSHLLNGVADTVGGFTQHL